MVDSSKQASFDLTVVVVILGRSGYLAACLEGLRGQRDVTQPEVIVPHDERLENVSQLRKQFPECEFLPHSGRRTYAQLRAAGVRRARGRIVALTEDHCIPEPDWCSNILRLHHGPYAAVGGAVDKQGKDSLLNWAIYLMDFSRYLNPVREGHSSYLTDVNVAYKREALAAIENEWQEEFHETTVNWTLQGRGETLWLSPRVVVQQRRALDLGDAIRERYRFGRLFASTRVAAAGMGTRLFYAAFSPALPLIFTARVASNVLRKRRAVRPFFLALPVLVFATVVWAWGETVGYLTARASPDLHPVADWGGASGE